MSATTSVDHEWTHDESTNRSAEKHRKNQGKLGCQKGVFLRGRWKGQKWGNGLEQGGAAWSEKIFKRQGVVVEWANF